MVYTNDDPPIHYLANLLHPQYRGKKIHGDHTNDLQDLVLEVSPDLRGEVCAIQTETVDIPAALNHYTARAKTGVWWKCIKKSSKITPELL